MSLCCLIFVYVIANVLSAANCVTTAQFYPFAVLDDSKLWKSGDGMTRPEEILVDTPVSLFSSSDHRIYVHEDGFVTLQTPVEGSSFGFRLPANVRVIAPFLADVDLGISGEVYYRHSEEPSLMKRSAEEIRNVFPVQFPDFQPSALIVITWHRVARRFGSSNEVNTFQLVLSNGAADSFAMFMYAEDEFDWISSGQTFAAAGFDSGDGSRVYLQTHSGTDATRLWPRESNVGRPGVWIYHIGLSTRSVGMPHGNLPEYAEFVGSDQAVPCDADGQICGRHGECRATQNGVCCTCRAGFVGSGYSCLRESDGERRYPLRVDGILSIDINDIKADDIRMVAYITTDRRVYFGIETVAPALDQPLINSLKPLTGTVDVLAWLWARDNFPVNNVPGVRVTGPEVNETIRIQFDSGEELIIENQLHNFVAFDKGQIKSHWRGTVPKLGPELIEVENYTKIYERSGFGQISGRCDRYFTVTPSAPSENNFESVGAVPIRRRFVWEHQVRFVECRASPREFGDSSGRQQLTVASPRATVSSGQGTDFLKFEMIGYVGPISDTGFCREDLCAGNAFCLVDNEAPNGYLCKCNEGYRGDGNKECIDIDECYEGTHSCSRNAECVNMPGSYYCKCLPGYEGSGHKCERKCELTCHELAQCFFDPVEQRDRCQCTGGYEGDGITNCQLSNVDCDRWEQCGENSECRPPVDGIRDRWRCECRDGFVGNGLHCTPAIPNRCHNCHQNATCQLDTVDNAFVCQCSVGFFGDGTMCFPTDFVARPPDGQQCDITKCSQYAECALDATGLRFACKCRPGFVGDGFNCELAPDNCYEDARVCHERAVCLPVPESDSESHYRCECKPGYKGDGYTNCKLECSCPADPNFICVEETDADGALKAVCKCAEHFEEMNGKCVLKDKLPCKYRNQCPAGTFCVRGVCQQEDCRLDPAMCHEEALCKERNGVFVCQCQSGYVGDGYKDCILGSDMVSSMQGAHLVFSRGIALHNMSVDGYKETKNVLTHELVYEPNGVVIAGVDFHCGANLLFWTDAESGTIYRSRLDGSRAERLLEDLGSPEGIAVDWLQNTIYWTDSRLDRIETAASDGSYRQIIIDTGLADPRAIVVYPDAEWLLWTDWERSNPRIERAMFDGSNREVIFSGADGLVLPNALTIDREARQLCWADAGSHLIKCTPMPSHCPDEDHQFGSARTVYDKAKWPFALVAAGRHLFWTDWDDGSIYRVASYGRSEAVRLELPPGGQGRVYGIVAVRNVCFRRNFCSARHYISA